MGGATVGEVLISLLPRLAGKRTRGVPVWPPDVFALMACLVRRAGLYHTVLTAWPPVAGYAGDCQRVAKAWRESADRGGRPPLVVGELWKDVVRIWGTPIEALAAGSREIASILRLLAIADECGAGLDGSDAGRELTRYTIRAARNLREGSLCDEIHPSRVRVLPKRRTPPTGFNIRSLSLYLACVDGGEVRPMWVAATWATRPRDTLNVLVIPFPFEIDPLWFRPVSAGAEDTGNLDLTRFGYFCVDRPASPDKVRFILEAALSLGERHAGRIDLVLFPELALTLSEYLIALEAAGKAGAMLMAGIHDPSVASAGASENAVLVSNPMVSGAAIRQRKQHRWKLTQSQIETYGLGATLNPPREWWEYISIADRTQHFLQMERWLLIAPLICEDLARPDPGGDLVRAVGPDLVIAFLMDGPQLPSRWPARYATVLADDPGCSVLTVTSLGMALRSIPRHGGMVSRNIASWKDPVNGLREIDVAGDKDVAVVLTLNQDTRRNEGYRQVAADGRENVHSTGFPILSRVQQLDLTEYGRKK